MVELFNHRYDTLDVFCVALPQNAGPTGCQHVVAQLGAVYGHKIPLALPNHFRKRMGKTF